MMQKDHFFSGGGAPPPTPLLFEPAMRGLDATWGCSQDEYAQFELPVSVTSMAAAAAMDSGRFAISELVGELSNMCGSRPPFAAPYGNVGDIYSLGNSLPLNTPAISPAPAKLSCLGNRSFNRRTAQSGSSSPSMKQPGTETRPEPSIFSGHNSIAEPSPSDQLPSGGSSGELNPRKRKPVAGIRTDGHSNGKKSKQSKAAEMEVKDDNGGGDGNESNQQKPFEPPKDYIHVRARRGQATDSHSLAERVRREKISERMKLLQDLVPGCNKVTGKALMLDEIINYVQSLQRQVEFLSMKLATLNPRVDCNAPNLLPKDICQTNEALPRHAYTSDSSGPAFRYAKIPQLNESIPNGSLSQCPPPSLYSLDASPSCSLGMQFSSMDGFGETLTQLPLAFEDDLQSIVKMGFN